MRDQTLNQTRFATPKSSNVNYHTTKRLITGENSFSFQQLQDLLPIPSAVIDSQSKLICCNEELKNLMNMNELNQLNSAVQSFKVQKIPDKYEKDLSKGLDNSKLGKASRFSDRFQQESRKSIDIERRRAISFLQNSSIQYECLAYYIRENITRQNNKKKHHLLKVQTDCFPNKFIIDIYPIKEDLMGSFIIFFYDLEDYERVITKDIQRRLMRQMSKSFSHEFATSLNCIQSLAQAALETISDRSLSENILKPILNSSIIMNSIVQDVRDFTQFIQHVFEIKIQEQVDLVKVVEQVQSMFEMHLQNKKLGFFVHLDKKCKTIIATDPQRLKQILVNLISNAQKNTFEGKIEVYISRFSQDRNHYIKFEVHDTGIGMKPEITYELTNLLSYGMKSKNGNDGSTFGLGLLISNYIAQSLSDIKRKNGGGIQFISEEGKGSKFSFLIADYTAFFFSEESETPHILKVNSKLVCKRETKRHKSRFCEDEQFRQRSKNQSIVGSRRSVQLDKGRRISVGMGTRLIAQDKLDQVQRTWRQGFQLEDIEQHHMEDLCDEFYDLVFSVPPEASEQIQKKDVAKYDQWVVRNPAYKQYTEKQNTLIQAQIQTDQFAESMRVIACECKKILVVDDEIFNVYALEALLRTFNLKIEYAYSGHMALELYERKIQKPCEICKESYRLILMDVNMPIMDGYATAAQIINLSQIYQIPSPVIAAQTAFSDSETENLCFLSGMSFFLTKPIQKSELQSVLSEVKLV